MAEDVRLTPIDSNVMLWQLQPSDNEIGDDADKVVFRTDGTLTRNTNITTDDTMDGQIASAGAKSQEASFTSYVVAKDPSVETLRHCWDKGISVKVWRTNLKDKTEEGYFTDFFYALIEDMEESESTGSKVELSVSLTIQGQSVAGRMEVAQDIVDTALYGFEKPGEWTGDLNDPNRTKDKE